MISQGINQILERFGASALPLPPEPHPCPYLPGRTANFEHYLIVDCGENAFQALLENGFRRFGAYFFRPACTGTQDRPRCVACRPLRVDIPRFQPSKSQRRAWNKGRDIAMLLGRPRDEDGKYELYLRHKARFRKQPEAATINPDDEDGSPADRESFHFSFYQPDPFSWECQYFVQDKLAGVGLIDVASRLLSSRYFFFDPEFERLSLGVVSILREIELARQWGIPYYYLGYAIADQPSMSYKMSYRPCEILDDGVWRPLRDEHGRYLI